MSYNGSFGKRLFDIVFSIIFLTLTSPILLISVIAIRLESKGKAFFIQERTGLKGDSFRMVKLRGMVDNAESLGPELTQINDPRLTRVGKILRRISVDEIPQTINVLKGDMSVVGPRPEIPSITARFTDDQCRVFDFKPGITGISQINGRQMLTPEERVEMEVHYYQNATFLSDLKIILQTPWIVISNKGNI